MKWTIPFDKQNAISFLIMTWMVSLLYSRALLSMSMMALVALSLVDWKKSGKLHFKNPLPTFKAFIKDPVFAPISLFFILVMISCSWSSDMVYGLERLRLKVPYLMLPFAFFSFPRISPTRYRNLLFFFLLLMTLSLLPVLINYYSDFERINQLIMQGQSIPTPISHIRYSLCISIAILSALYLLMVNAHLPKKKKIVISISALFLFVGLHILSVRSGLFCLYAGLLLVLVNYIFQSRNYRMGLAGILVVVLIPILAVKYIPSLKKKMDYTYWDWSKYGSDSESAYSDSDRFRSIQIGLKIWNKSKLIGIGAGDVKTEMYEIYDRLGTDRISYKLPHNQYITVLLGTGILGLILFLYASLAPLFRQKNYKDLMLLLMTLVILSSYLFENTIESSKGIAIHLLFLLLPLYFLKKSA